MNSFYSEIFRLTSTVSTRSTDSSGIRSIIDFFNNIFNWILVLFKKRKDFFPAFQLITFVVLIISFFPFSLSGQNQLSQSFRFESGVYLTFAAFQKNTPTYSAEAIEGNFFINESTKQAKVEYIRLKENQESLDLDKMWGIVIKGVPYVKVTPNLPPHSLKVFATMEVRGNICYFAYDDIEQKTIPFKVYNPVLGRPYRTSMVNREVKVIKEKILKFDTGEVDNFNYQNLLVWLAEDKEIVKALRSLGAQQAEEKLFDALLVFNEKYAVSLK